MPGQARPTRPDCGDGTVAHGADRSARTLSAAAGCTAAQQSTGAPTTSRCRGTPRNVPSTHLAGTLVTVATAPGHSWLQHKHHHINMVLLQCNCH